MIAAESVSRCREVCETSPPGGFHVSLTLVKCLHISDPTEDTEAPTKGWSCVSFCFPFVLEEYVPLVQNRIRLSRRCFVRCDSASASGGCSGHLVIQVFSPVGRVFTSRFAEEINIKCTVRGVSSTTLALVERVAFKTKVARW